MTDAEQPSSRKWLRYVFLAGYFASWTFAAAIATFFPFVYVWENAHLSQQTGIDDDVTLLGFPLGAALGVWGAIRTRHAQAFHWTCLALGSTLPVIGVWESIRLFDQSARLTGTGPLAGVAELIAAILAIVFTFFGVCVLGIGVFGRLADRR